MPPDRSVVRRESKGNDYGSVAQLSVKIFADGADLEGILRAGRRQPDPGFTTNPTLMRKSGITEYEGFARKVLDHISDRPVSFEVFSDEFDEMARQAAASPRGARTSTIKIPITNTRCEVRPRSFGSLRRRVCGSTSLQS